MWLLYSSAVALALDRNVPAPYPTIQAAVDAAVPGDTILIDAGQGPYVETVALSTSGLTVMGANGRSTLVPANDDDGAFWITGVANVVLSNLRIEGGGTRRGLRVGQSQLTLTDVEFVNTYNSGVGGAIWAEGSSLSRLTVEACAFEASSADDEGGSIAVFSGNLVLEGCSFTGGSSGRDGGHVYVQDAGTVTIQGGTFTEGQAVNGGSLYLKDSGVFTVLDAVLALNQGDSAAGAIYLDNVDESTVYNTTFEGNGAGSGGGAVSQVAGNGTYEGNTWCSNTAGSDGGALELSEGSGTTMVGDVFLGNAADGDGGAVWGGMTTSLSHTSAALNDTAGNGHAFAGRLALLNVVDSYLADHPPGGPTLWTLFQDDATTRNNGFWRNAGGNWSDTVQDLGGNQIANARIPIPPEGVCDRELLRPPSGSVLVGAASDGTTIGALEPYPEGRDGDGDGFEPPKDCDDSEPGVHPGAIEIPTDGIDGDCDGSELCFVDDDRDGYGTPETLPSSDWTCSTPGLANNDQESCPGFDDHEDRNDNGLPDGCEADGAVRYAPGYPRGGCGCASQPPPAGIWAVLIGLLLRRRGRPWGERGPLPSPWRSPLRMRSTPAFLAASTLS